ncbi:MAG: DUF3826 domain-containing protein [Alistipes sp.]|jgi:hypothetical protein|nr:DUF3826 domain-containing protein [Alistipes sp.]MBQ5904134.1 DUF3826 domain-containing protein [Alistipes sp.]
MKKMLFSLLLIVACMTASAVELKSEGRDPGYVESIVKRSQKIVDKLDLKDEVAKKEVLHIIANRYFELNDIYEARNKRKEEFKAMQLPEEYKQLANDFVRYECDSKLYRSHFAFPATLSIYLTPEQVTAVMDGMTYGVVKVTYDSHLDMIPTLTDEEKAQIEAWLIEAREFAVDAESSNKKHEAFGKYKGRINNYLSKRGYDLKAEREAWYKRIEERKAKEAKKAKKK